MLQFIETEAEKLLRESIFKNNLMLQFIESAWKLKAQESGNLKTSHVTVYRCVVLDVD